MSSLLDRLKASMESPLPAPESISWTDARAAALRLSPGTEYYAHELTLIFEKLPPTVDLRVVVRGLLRSYTLLERKPELTPIHEQRGSYGRGPDDQYEGRIGVGLRKARILVSNLHVEFYASIDQTDPMDNARGDGHEQERLLQYLWTYHGDSITAVLLEALRPGSQFEDQPKRFQDADAEPALRKLARGEAP